MRLGLKHRIMVLALTSAIVPLAVIMMVSVPLERNLGHRMVEELLKLSQANTSQITRDIFNLCKTIDDMVKRQIEYSIAGAHAILEERGGVQFAST